MRIAEIFRSVQGEGRLTGTESIFVRTSGCNLRCRYCDTRYASWTPEGERLAPSEVLWQVDDLRHSRRPLFLNRCLDATSPDEVRHVVLTGGEPMLLNELVALTAVFRAKGWHITIETSGTRYLPVTCDLMSISPKLSNSTPSAEDEPQWHLRHSRDRHAPEVIRRLTAEYDYQMKFVVDSPADCREVDAYLTEFPTIEHPRVMLMPQGVDAEALAEKAAWMKPHCVERGFQFCPRRHVEWFGAKRGM
jgi:7-carboxy-7-deazaguanine synthase